jgi:hypothetical protein
MKRFPICLLFTALALPVPSSFAQEESPVVCEDLSISISDVPDAVTFSFTVPTDNLLKSCHSTTDASLHLVTPLTGVTITAEPGLNSRTEFTVADSDGNEGRAILVVTRN